MSSTKKWVLSIFGCVVGLVLIATHAQAIIYSLDCVISNSGCAPGATYGTIAFTDNGNNVDVTVDLVGTENKVLAV